MSVATVLKTAQLAGRPLHLPVIPKRLAEKPLPAGLIRLALDMTPRIEKYVADYYPERPFRCSADWEHCGTVTNMILSRLPHYMPEAQAASFAVGYEMELLSGGPDLRLGMQKLYQIAKEMVTPNLLSSLCDDSSVAFACLLRLFATPILFDGWEFPSLIDLLAERPNLQESDFSKMNFLYRQDYFRFSTSLEHMGNKGLLKGFYVTCLKQRQRIIETNLRRLVLPFFSNFTWFHRVAAIRIGGPLYLVDGTGRQIDINRPVVSIFEYDPEKAIERGYILPYDPPKLYPADIWS